MRFYPFLRYIYLEQHSCIMKDVRMNGTDEHHKI